MPNRKLGISICILALVASACGSGASESTTSSAPPTEPSTATTSTTLPDTTDTTAVTSTTAAAATSTTEHLTATATMIVVQQDLAVLGYFSGVVDGIAGEQTRAALAKFQSDAGLEADGEFGSKTDAAIKTRLQKDVVYVEDLQKELIDLGHYSGPVDGDYGAGTERGVKLLEKSCGLEQTGELSIKTRLCLGGHI